MSDPKEIQRNNERKSDITNQNETVNKSIPTILKKDVEEENCNYPDDFEEDENNDEYGRNGEKYGWYNGFSDDVIDDAFEGDPDATWNVD